MKFSAHILNFFSTLSFPEILPPGIEVMNPYSDPQTFEACENFYRKFYNDNNERHMIIGINPGRFGAGVTGIPFTDPVRLASVCGINNSWPKKQELSSVFIYEMIQTFGGVNDFYQKFYITAVSPLGFTRNNKNLNYYDDKTLQRDIKSFVTGCFEKQFAFGIAKNVAFCLGDGKNYQYLSKLNNEMKFFEQVIPLPHPRFIMQYKLRRKEEYIQLYLDKLRKII